MPLYEYVCDKDGEVIELLRSAADADNPIEDPKGLGRAFKRRHSTFAAKSGSPNGSTSIGPVSGGCCPCGKTNGSCGSR